MSALPLNQVLAINGQSMACCDKNSQSLIFIYIYKRLGNKTVFTGI